MDDVGDFYRIGQCPVHDDKRQRWERQFPCSFHGALSATMREGLESASALINLSGSTVHGGGTVLTNVGTMAARSSAACGDQRTCILRTKHPFDTLSYLFVREVFAPVELLQPLVDVLAKPCVMVEIMLYKLLNIPVSIAAVLSSDAVQLGLQVWAEMYFHRFSMTSFRASNRSTFAAPVAVAVKHVSGY